MILILFPLLFLTVGIIILTVWTLQVAFTTLVILATIAAKIVVGLCRRIRIGLDKQPYSQARYSSRR